MRYFCELTEVLTLMEFAFQKERQTGWSKENEPYETSFWCPLLTWNCNIWMNFLAFSFPLFLPLFYAVTQLLSDPMDYGTPGFPVLHHLLEFVQIHVYWVSGAIQSSHPLSPPSPPALKFPGIRVFSNESALHQVAKGLEFQLQHQSFQWTLRTDLL